MKVYLLKLLCINNNFCQQLPLCCASELHVMVLLCYSTLAIVLSCFTWLTCPYSSGLLHWHRGNHMIAPVPVKKPWSIWVKITTTQPQHTTFWPESKKMYSLPKPLKKIMAMLGTYYRLIIVQVYKIMVMYMAFNQVYKIWLINNSNVWQIL